MKFLIDMGLGRSTASFLRLQGHDALHLRDQGLQRLSDTLIVDKAVSEGRTILTHDLDFGRLVAMSRQNLPSVITFRLTDMRAHNVNNQLQVILDRFVEELESGALVSVTDQAIRIRRLPVKR